MLSESLEFISLHPILHKHLKKSTRLLGYSSIECRLLQTNLTVVQIYDVSTLKVVRGKKVLTSVTLENNVLTGNCKAKDKRHSIIYINTVL